MIGILPGPDGVPITIKRTNRRKTVAIHVDGGDIRILAPKRLSVRTLQDLIEHRSDWIRAKLHLQAARPSLPPRTFVEGDRFAYLGRVYRLEIDHTGPAPARLKSGRLIVAIRPGDGEKARIEASLADWYRHQAGRHLAEKTVRFASTLDVRPKAVTLKNYRSRWGSCTARGDIFYNWRIIMAPSRIVDYLVVHELAHLVHHNHSPRFWACVASVLPDYRAHRDWLKLNGATLRL